MKGTTKDMPVPPKEMLEAHLKRLQLITRLLVLSSAYEGFSLSADDVQSLGFFLLDYIGKVQETLTEVKK
jgi:Fic family protein